MIILGRREPQRSTTTQHVMVYVTTPDRDTARVIAREVLSRRLAACANLTPIESLYWWEGRIEESPEVLLIFTTRRDLAGPLLEAVKARHTYETPCIVTYPMDAGFPPFLEWLDRETRPQR